MSEAFDFDNPEHAKQVIDRADSTVLENCTSMSEIMGDGTREERLQRLMEHQRKIRIQLGLPVDDGGEND